MICLAVGLGVLGAIAFRRARRCHHRGGWHGHHYRHWQGWQGRHRRHTWMVHAMLDRIDASPAQERVIVGELEKLVDRVYGARSGLREARSDLGAAIRGTTLDDAALGAVLGRVDGATAEVRTATIEALRNIHAVLDDRQRAQVADLIDRGGGWRTGPYR